MNAVPIPKERALQLRIARVVSAAAFVGFVIAAAAGSRLVWVALVVAGVSLLVAYAWRCPTCRRTFALKLGLIGIAMPYTNACLHCGSRLQ